MKTLLVALASIAAIAAPLPTSAPAEIMLASVQSADSTRQPNIRIELSGGLLKSLGFANGATGTLSLSGRGGSATGTLSAELTDESGALTFSTAASDPEIEVRVWPGSGAPVPRYQARGHRVRVVRAADGTLGVQAIR